MVDCIIQKSDDIKLMVSNLLRKTQYAFNEFKHTKVRIRKFETHLLENS